MRLFYIIIVVLVFVLMQVALAGRIAIGHIEPDFLILIVAIFALYRGAVQGAVLGFIVGFLQDLTNPGFLGLNALAKSILGHAVGTTAAKTFPENVPFLFILFMSVSFGHDLIYLVFYHWPHMGTAFVALFSTALPSAAYTAVMGVAVQKLLSLASPKVVESLGKEGQ